MKRIDQLQVIQDGRGYRRRSHHTQTSHIARQSVAEKILGHRGARKEGVVVEQHKMFGQILDAPKIQLQDIRIEGRQPLARNILLVAHHMEFRVGRIEPRGEVSPSDEVHLAHPGGKLLHGTKQIAQCAPIAVTNRRGIHACLDPILSKFGLPGGVGTIDPGKY